MAVAEVNALSGYQFDSDEMNKLIGTDLKRVELENDDTKMNIYFNPVNIFKINLNFLDWRHTCLFIII